MVCTLCQCQHTDQNQGPYCHSQEQSDQGLHQAILSSLIRVYIVCHSQQPDQGLHSLPFSTVWFGSTLFAMISSLVNVYTIYHSQQSDQGLHCLPFLEIWLTWTLFATLSSLIRVYTIFHSQQTDQGLHYLRFFLSSIIKVSTVCHSQQSDQGLYFFSIISLIRVYTVYFSQFEQSLHCLPFSTVWSESTLPAILSRVIKDKIYTVILRNSLIRVYTFCHF